MGPKEKPSAPIIDERTLRDAEDLLAACEVPGMEEAVVRDNPDSVKALAKAFGIKGSKLSGPQFIKALKEGVRTERAKSGVEAPADVPVEKEAGPEEVAGAKEKAAADVEAGFADFTADNQAAANAAPPGAQPEVKVVVEETQAAGAKAKDVALDGIEEVSGRPPVLSSAEVDELLRILSGDAEGPSLTETAGQMARTAEGPIVLNPKITEALLKVPPLVIPEIIAAIDSQTPYIKPIGGQMSEAGEWHNWSTLGALLGSPLTSAQIERLITVLGKHNIPVPEGLAISPDMPITSEVVVLSHSAVETPLEATPENLLVLVKKIVDLQKSLPPAVAKNLKITSFLYDQVPLADKDTPALEKFKKLPAGRLKQLIKQGQKLLKQCEAAVASPTPESAVAEHGELRPELRPAAEVGAEGDQIKAGDEYEEVEVPTGLTGPDGKTPLVRKEKRLKPKPAPEAEPDAEIKQLLNLLAKNSGLLKLLESLSGGDREALEDKNPGLIEKVGNFLSSLPADPEARAAALTGKAGDIGQRLKDVAAIIKALGGEAIRPKAAARPDAEREPEAAAGAGEKKTRKRRTKEQKEADQKKAEITKLGAALGAELDNFNDHKGSLPKEVVAALSSRSGPIFRLLNYFDRIKEHNLEKASPEDLNKLLEDGQKLRGEGGQASLLQQAIKRELVEFGSRDIKKIRGVEAVLKKQREKLPPAVWRQLEDKHSELVYQLEVYLANAENLDEYHETLANFGGVEVRSAALRRPDQPLCTKAENLWSQLVEAGEPLVQRLQEALAPLMGIWEKHGDINLRRAANEAKIRQRLQAQGAKPEEIERALEQARFVTGKELLNPANGLNEAVDGLLRKAVAGRNFHTAEIGDLAEALNLPPSVIEAAVKNQQSRISEWARLEVRRQNKTGWGKKLTGVLTRVGIYGTGGAAVTGGLLALGIVGTAGMAGVVAGSALGLARLVETYRLAKKDADQLKAEENKIKDLIARGDPQDPKRQELLQGLASELALAKQKQIDGKDESDLQLVTELTTARQEYLAEYRKAQSGKKVKGDILAAKRKEYKNLCEDQIDSILNDVENNLRDQGVTSEQREKIYRQLLGLLRVDMTSSIMEEEIMALDQKGALRRAGQWTAGKINKALSGGETVEAKMTTATIFAGAGVLARELPILRSVMLGFAGWKGGEAIGMWRAGKDRRFQDLQMLNANSEVLRGDNVSDEALNRARAQLLDPEFRKQNPGEFARLQERVDAITQMKIQKAENTLKTVKDLNSDLGYSYSRRQLLKTEQKKKLLRYQLGGAALGAVGGAVIPLAIREGVDFIKGHHFLGLAQAAELPGQTGQPLQELQTKLAQSLGGVKDPDVKNYIAAIVTKDGLQPEDIDQINQAMTAVHNLPAGSRDGVLFNLLADGRYDQSDVDTLSALSKISGLAGMDEEKLNYIINSGEGLKQNLENIQRAVGSLNDQQSLDYLNQVLQKGDTSEIMAVVGAQHCELVHQGDTLNRLLHRSLDGNKPLALKFVQHYLGAEAAKSVDELDQGIINRAIAKAAAGGENLAYAGNRLVIGEDGAVEIFQAGGALDAKRVAEETLRVNYLVENLGVPRERIGHVTLGAGRQFTFEGPNGQSFHVYGAGTNEVKVLTADHGLSRVVRFDGQGHMVGGERGFKPQAIGTSFNEFINKPVNSYFAAAAEQPASAVPGGPSGVGAAEGAAAVQDAGAVAAAEAGADAAARTGLTPEEISQVLGREGVHLAATGEFATELKIEAYSGGQAVPPDAHLILLDRAGGDNDRLLVVLNRRVVDQAACDAGQQPGVDTAAHSVMERLPQIVQVRDQLAERYFPHTVGRAEELLVNMRTVQGGSELPTFNQIETFVNASGGNVDHLNNLDQCRLAQSLIAGHQSEDVGRALAFTHAMTGINLADRQMFANLYFHHSPSDIRHFHGLINPNQVAFSSDTRIEFAGNRLTISGLESRHHPSGFRDTLIFDGDTGTFTIERPGQDVSLGVEHYHLINKAIEADTDMSAKTKLEDFVNTQLERHQPNSEYMQQFVGQSDWPDGMLSAQDRTAWLFQKHFDFYTDGYAGLVERGIVQQVEYNPQSGGLSYEILAPNRNVRYTFCPERGTMVRESGAFSRTTEVLTLESYRERMLHDIEGAGHLREMQGRLPDGASSG